MCVYGCVCVFVCVIVCIYNVYYKNKPVSALLARCAAAGPVVGMVTMDLSILKISAKYDITGEVVHICI